MHENPFLTAWFFKYRATVFIQEVIRPIFGVVDYWYRYEWQWRGSPHVHGLLWLKDAPATDEIDSLNEEQRASIVTYFDSICSATNPGVSSSSYIHPCRKSYSREDNETEDLAQLVETVQRHTRCGDHCLRKHKGTNRKQCRFGFPKRLQEQSTIAKENGVWKFFPKRNDPLLSRYNCYISRVWRANTDFTPVISREAVLKYIAKYASKCEKPSASYNDLLRNIVEQSAPESSANTAIRKFIISC